jgi:hypothetical protein
VNPFTQACVHGYYTISQEKSKSGLNIPRG